MYGGSGKMGRGGGRGTTKRRPHSTLPPAPPHRPSCGPVRPPIVGGAASRHWHAGGSGRGSGAGPPAHEENFSLLSCDPLAFGMIIRLTPDLVEEIRRVESQGGATRIKFGPNPDNPSGNVIDVGGKDFRFTWSRELGDCDIYEERQSGEDGNGLLVESGCAWRKLNVHRILDESTKNHVKMRSVEAERQSKSRKAIVLDHGNPSMKNQIKALAAAAVDSNTRWMPFNKKKEAAFKKRKPESSQVAVTGPSKSVSKTSISSTTIAKDRLSVSPVRSPPEPVASAATFGIGNPSGSNANADEVTVPQPTNKEKISSVPQLTNKENISNFEKETAKKAVSSLAQKVRKGDTPEDLRNTLISLLSENPKGMTLKALEKAIGDTTPNSGRKIEAIIKKIATFRAPGRYFLKPGVEMESFKRPSSESGSSPESARDQIPVAESNFLEKAAAEEFEQQIQLNSRLGDESNLLEKIDIQNSPDHMASDRKVSNNNNEGRVGSSSESGSDSDSDSDTSGSDSDSESQSRSRSKSRSPAGSGSPSSSDSESDGSSSSKEVSDVDVDIMASDDEKQDPENKWQVPDSRQSTSPVITYDNGHEQDDDKNKQNAWAVSTPNLKATEECDDDMVEAIEVTKGSPIDEIIKTDENCEPEMADNTEFAPHETKEGSVEEQVSFSPTPYKQSEDQQVSYAMNDISGRTVKQSGSERWTKAKHSSGHDQSEEMEKVSRNKSKRASDPKRFLEKSESSKRLKVGSSAPVPYKDHNSMMSSDREGSVDIDSRKGYGLTVPERPAAYENSRSTQLGGDLQNVIPDVQQSPQRTGYLNSGARGLDVTERPGKYAESLCRGAKHSDRVSVFPDDSNGSTLKNVYPRDKFSNTKDKQQKETQDEDSDACEKYSTKNVGDRKSGEQSGKLKDVGWMPHSQASSLPRDNSKSDADKGNILKRELSDLELGEFREPVPGEEIGVKRQFERKNSFKSSENKSSASGNLNSDFSKGRIVGKTNQEPKRQSPPHTKAGSQGNTDRWFKKRMLVDDAEDSTRPQQRAELCHAQFSKVDPADSDAGSQLDKLADMASRARKNEARASQGNGVETHASTHRMTPLSTLQQNDPKSMNSASVKESKQQKSNTGAHSADRRKDCIWTEGSSNGRRRESFSDEDDLVYSKYDKDEPELRGPIRDLSEYRKYVQEYREKYEHYQSLGKQIEKYRSDFDKLGCDLEHARGRDLEAYNKIGKKIVESWRQSGEKHKWMKKIFVVLHEELGVLKQRIVNFAGAYTGQNYSDD